MKRISIYILTIMLLFTSVFIVNSATKTKIQSNDVSLSAGQSFELPIYISNNTGLTALSLELKYDSDILTINSARNGNVFSNEQFSFSKTKGTLNWINGDMTNISGNGILGYVSFTVNSDSESTTSAIGLNITQSFDANYDDVEIETQNVNVNIQGLDKTVKSINVVKPTKLSYKTNDTIDMTGLKVTAKYDDNSELDVTSKVQVSDVDMSTAGTKIIKITYKQFAYSFFIKVSLSNVLDINVDTNSCASGNTVDIPIKIENNPGIIGVTFNVVFDNDKMKLNSVSNGDVFEKSNMTLGGNLDTSPYKIVFENGKLKTNIDSIGTLATLSFSLKDNVPAGEYKVSITDVQAIDKDLNTVDYDLENGEAPLYTAKYILGDANGDGSRDIRDVTTIQRYVSGYSDSISNSLLLSVADCDQNGSVTIRDVTLVQKILVGSVDDSKYCVYKYE